jgi:hypothetical protein
MYAFQLAAGEKILKKSVGTAHIGDKAGLGALYLTTERVVFVGFERLLITTTVEEEIPLEHIDEIRAEKSLAVLPNAIAISTIRGQRFKFVVDGRDAWIAAIRGQMDKI